MPILKKNSNCNNWKKHLEIRCDKNIHRTGDGHFSNNAKTRTDRKKNVKINRTKYTLKESHSNEAGTRSKGGRIRKRGVVARKLRKNSFVMIEMRPFYHRPPPVHLFFLLSGRLIPECMNNLYRSGGTRKVIAFFFIFHFHYFRRVERHVLILSLLLLLLYTCL